MAEFGFGVVAAVIGDQRGGVLQKKATGVPAIAAGQEPLRQRVADLIDGQAFGRIGRRLLAQQVGLERHHPRHRQQQAGIRRDERSRRHDGVIKLVVTAGQRELVVATKLDYLFETFKDEDEALDSFLPWDTTAGIP